MIWTEASALLWTERAIAIAIVLQTLEFLQIRSTLRDDGVWRWSILRREHGALPFLLRWTLAAVLPYRPFVALLFARLACVTLWIAGQPHLVWFLLFSQVAICVRFRGTFNGGSDYMTVLILLSLCAAEHPLLMRAGLLYIAVQATLSYVIAGLVKLKEPAWRSGEAVRAFLGSTHYGAPALVRRLAATPRSSRLLSAAVIGFECGFPLALIDARVCLVVLVLGAGFHLTNAIVFGLNRFLFAWVAAYPALFFCSQLLGSNT